jgi:hypothetical protein
MRIVSLPRVSNECLMTIEAADLLDPQTVTSVKVKRAPIGFETPHEENCEANSLPPQAPACEGSSTPHWRSSFDFDDDLKHDPQEDDPRLWAFFQTAEKEAQASLAGVVHGLGSGRTLAVCMKKILKQKYGIEWKSVFELNPGWHLD